MKPDIPQTRYNVIGMGRVVFVDACYDTEVQALLSEMVSERRGYLTPNHPK